VSELFLSIPCEPASGPDRVRPIYEFIGLDATGAARCQYRCPYCGQTGPRVKPLRNHMGLNMNIPASCRVLAEQDQARRKGRTV
jgi:hypothetical protein